MGDRAFLDLGTSGTARGRHDADQLYHELDAGTPPLTGKDAHVFETDESPQDLSGWTRAKVFLASWLTPRT